MFRRLKLTIALPFQNNKLFVVIKMGLDFGTLYHAVQTKSQ